MSRTAYIDRDNLISLANTIAIADSYEEIKKCEACIDILKGPFIIKFNFSMDEEPDDDAVQSLMISLMEQCDGNSIPTYKNENEAIFPPRIDNGIDVFDTFNKDQLLSIYLIDDTKISIKNIKDSGSLLVSGIGNEINTLSTLLIDDKKTLKTISIRKEMGDAPLTWNFVTKNSRPCTDIIIQARYVFSFLDRVAHNLYSLLLRLCANMKDTSLNIVIVCEGKYNKKSHLIGPDIAKARQEIKTLFKIANIDAFVSFILVKYTNKWTEIHKKQKYPLHNRLIFTNYQFYVSASPLNIYDNNNILNPSGNDITFHWFSDIDNQEKAEEDLGDINFVIEKIHENSFLGDLDLDTRTPACNFLNI